MGLEFPVCFLCILSMFVRLSSTYPIAFALPSWDRPAAPPCRPPRSWNFLPNPGQRGTGGFRCFFFLPHWTFPRGRAMILSADETALRFLRAAAAAQFHQNGSFAPLLWNSAIVAMRISTGAPRRSRGRCKVFGQFRPKTLHLNKAYEP